MADGFHGRHPLACKPVAPSLLRPAACRSTAGKAYGAVDVPESVIDLLTGVRNHLQDKCEPPVYVSDRRFMKAIKMLQARLSHCLCWACW